MIDLSISIVAYNDKADVQKCIYSIEAFTDKSITKHIYVIDNSEVPLFGKNELGLFDDVEYIFTGKNLGFGAGHNCVLQRLDSKFHAIVNPDILFKEDTFSNLIRFMNSNDCGMVIPRLLDEEGTLQKAYRRELTITDMFIRMFLKGGFAKRRAYHTMDDMDYEHPFEVPFAQGSFLFIKTEILKKLKGFDERYFMYMEDADLCKRLWQIDRLLYCPYTSVIHRWEKGSHKSKKLLKIHIQSMLKYFHKWGWKF